MLLLLLLSVSMAVQVDAGLFEADVELIQVCDEPYGTALTNINLTTHNDGILTCAVACRQHNRCTSIVVNTVTNQCTLYNVARDDWPACGSPDAIYAFVAPASTMRQTCSMDENCVDDQSECRDGLCRCIAGLVFEPSSRKCVENCTNGYGNTFQVDFGHFIAGFADQTLSGVTEEQCTQACADATSFVCRHAEYYFGGSSNECYISRHSKAEAQAISSSCYISNPHFNLHFRDCA